MGFPHHFDEDLACKYGVNAAIMIAHLQTWIRKNRANGTNFHEGRWWTYNSTKAWAELLPFWTPRKIELILGGLREARILVTGNFNHRGYDRTLWYAFRDEAAFVPLEAPISLNGEMNSTIRGNGLNGTVEPIPSSTHLQRTQEKEACKAGGAAPRLAKRAASLLLLPHPSTPSHEGQENIEEEERLAEPDSMSPALRAINDVSKSLAET